MQNKHSETLQKARLALQKGNQKAATTLLNQILQQDIHHLEAWELLYDAQGKGESLVAFQKKYTQQNFPKKLKELSGGNDNSIRRVSLTGGKDSSSKATSAAQPTSAAPSSPKQEKPGFFARLLSVFRRKPKEKAPAPPSPAKSSSPPVPPSVEEKQVRLASIKNTPPTPSLREELSITAPPPTISAPPISSFREIPQTPSDEKIRVLVVDDIAQTRENLVKLLSLEPSVEVIGGARTGGEGVSMAVQRDPHVILMDINMPDMDGLEATRLIRAKIPYVQVVILTVQDDPSYMREAIVAGARDFLVKPPMVEELISAVKRAYIIAREEKARMPPPPPSGFALAFTPETTDQAKRIISVFAPKGGVGCTTIASNLAVALHSDTTPVIVLDGRTQFGGIGISFNERSKHSMGDLTPRVEHLDPDVVHSVVTTHTGSGVSLLPAPEKISDGENIDPNQIGPLLKYLAKLYTYVIIDTATELTEHTLAVLDVSDLVLLVTTQDIPSLDRMRRFLDLAPAIGLNKDRFRILLSRYNEKINITPERISTNFKQEIACIIPSDAAVVSPSTNQGAPFMMDKRIKGRPIHKALMELAKIVEKEAEIVKA
ncbi:MAG: hypothetical protein Fur0022_35920 [Anaerolineales bacterium]